MYRSLCKFTNHNTFFRSVYFPKLTSTSAYLVFSRYGPNEFVRLRQPSKFKTFMTALFGGIQTGYIIAICTLMFAKYYHVWDARLNDHLLLHVIAIQVPIVYLYLDYILLFFLLVNAIIVCTMHQHKPPLCNKFDGRHFRDPTFVDREGRNIHIDPRLHSALYHIFS